MSIIDAYCLLVKSSVNKYVIFIRDIGRVQMDKIESFVSWKENEVGGFVIISQWLLIGSFRLG